MRQVFARRVLLGLAAVFVPAAALAAASPAAEPGPTPITQCTEAAVRAAVNAGGSYVFACDGWMIFKTPLVVSGGTVSLDGGGRKVTLESNRGIGRQVVQVMGGSLTLSRLTISGAVTDRLLDGSPAAGEQGVTGVAAVEGQPGADGVDGVSPTPGGNATNATHAGPGGDAKSEGKDVKGGAMHIGSGASVLLRHVTFSENTVRGGAGGSGGTGGYPSAGADGGNGGDRYGAALPGTPGGNGGHGGNGGDGGAGLPAGDGMGGAVYNEGTLTVEDSDFVANTAAGGIGGEGGFGGSGHCCPLEGGTGGHQGIRGYGCWDCAEQPGGHGGDGPDGGDGGTGADSGDALGGAIYSSGRLTVLRSTFSGNRAQGPVGGPGGMGGWGGPGGAGQRLGGTGGDGGDGGDGGETAAGGDAFGGAVYSTTSFVESGNAYIDNQSEVQGGSYALGVSGDRGGSGHGGAGAAGVEGADSPPGPAGVAGCGDVYQPGGGTSAATRTMAAAAAGPACDCGGLSQQIMGWKLEASGCPSEEALTKGIKGVTVTAPSGWQVSMPENNPTDYALPLESAGALRLPVVLPDLNLNAGGFSLGAYANTLDHDGLRIGTGWFEVPRFKTEGLVEDLHVGEGFKGSAGVVQLDLFDKLSLEASDVQFSAEGLKAGEFEVGLPALMGGAALSGRNLDVGPGGVSGELTGAEITIGDMTARFEEARLTPKGISIGSAELKLPPYLGSATLEAKGLTWDSTTHELGVESARGKVEFTVAGRAKVEAMVDFAFKPRGGFSLKGEGELRIEGGERPLFAAKAVIAVESIECDPAPGPCANGAFLHEAQLEISTDKRVPLGQTGLALTGLGGFVKSSPNEPPNNHRRDADGTIQGVTYTFGLKAGIETLVDNGFAFTGRIDATASTNGNFALGFHEATIFGYIRAYGEICARLVAEPDAVCDKLTRSHLAQRRGTGVFLGGAAEARVSYGGRLFTARADMRLEALGSIVNAGGETYLDAALEGTLSAGTSGWLLPDIQGSGRLNAEIGRFATPEGKSTLGVKGRLNATLKVRSMFGDREESVQRAIFIDRNGKYTEENVDGYTLGAARSKRLTSAAKKAGTHAFSIPAGQSQTMVVVDAKSGTPKLTLTAPGGMRIVAQAQKGKDPTISVKPARGKKLDRKLAAQIFVVRSRTPGALSIYLPKAQKGRWSARVEGVRAGSYRFQAGGNKPVPRLKVTAPAKGKTLQATPAKPSVALKGKLTGATKKATVSVYAASAPCVKRGGELVPESPGTLLASRVKVSKGAWSLKWNTAGVAPGRYVPYAVLANGSGPRVGDCSQGAVVVEGAAASARRAPAAGSKPVQASPRAAAASAAEIHRDVQGCAAVATLNPGVGSPAPSAPSAAGDLPVLHVKRSSTPCIAANIAAAVSGVDPFTRTPAVTADKTTRDYVPYSGAAPSTLTYSPFSNKEKKSVSTANRSAACGWKPFYNGRRPGPPDGVLDPKTGARSEGKLTSCDEYPYASSTEGGERAIIRGVPIHENRVQGGELSAFLRANANELAFETGSSGRFHVCVETTPRAGTCPP